MRLFQMIICFVVALVVPAVVLAQEAAQPDVGELVAAYNAGEWPLFAAVAIAMLVWLARIFMRGVFPASAVPWVMLATTVLGAASTSIYEAVQANHTWWGGLVSGLLSGVAVGVPAFFLYRQAHKEDPPAPKIQ